MLSLLTSQVAPPFAVKLCGSPGPVEDRGILRISDPLNIKRPNTSPDFPLAIQLARGIGLSVLEKSARASPVEEIS
jgi:hypothetical protein